MYELFRRTLVPIDGSESSLQALRTAAALLRGRGGEIVLLNVTNVGEVTGESLDPIWAGDSAPTIAAMHAQAGAALREAADEAAELGAAVRTLQCDGDPVATIAEAADELDATLIVIGSHGRRGAARFFMGSTAEGVLRTCSVPVMVVGPAAPRSDESTGGRRFAKIVVAVDDTEASDTGVQLAVKLAADEGATIYFVHVVTAVELLGAAAALADSVSTPGAELHEAARALVRQAMSKANARGVVAHGKITEGQPADEILQVASARGADLVVIGSHGRRGVRRFILGSVAENVARRSSVPVIVARPEAGTGLPAIERVERAAV